MKQIPAHEISISGIGDHNSISTGPDDGANANLRAIFWKSMGHSTFAEAKNNFLSRLFINEPDANIANAGNLNIGGHGNSGFLETGAGQHGQQDYRTNVLMAWSSYIWGPVLSELQAKNFPILYIYSCHSGAGESGADFLFELAKAIGRPVGGRTGFLYSNNQRLWFENGSVWQVATPDTRPNPIEAPTPHFSELPVESFLSEEKGSAIGVPDIKTIVITIPGHPQPLKTTTASQDVHPAIISALFASEPYTVPGAPAAMITATAEITFKHPNGGEEKRIFNVYNGRLTIDQTSGLAYYASPNLDQLIRSL